MSVDQIVEAIGKKTNPNREKYERMKELAGQKGIDINDTILTLTWGKIDNRCIEYMQRFFLTMVYIAVYTMNERNVIIMMTAKVFENGRSQAIRLPKECRFTSDEVMVNKIGDIVILLPKQNKWDSFMRAIDMFSDDFMADGRATDVVQEREEL